MSEASRRGLLAGLALLPAFRPAGAALPELEVWKTRGCGCCTSWAERFAAAGFATRVHEAGDLAAVRSAAGVPADLGGCHTGRIAGYTLEGHVPVAAVRRLLAERPPVRGLAVPGMPVGSPGMEIAGEPAQAYDVVAFADDGARYVFTTVAP